jgi:hypothetical protein
VDSIAGFCEVLECGLQLPLTLAGHTVPYTVQTPGYMLSMLILQSQLVNYRLFSTVRQTGLPPLRDLAVARKNL